MACIDAETAYAPKTQPIERRGKECGAKRQAQKIKTDSRKAIRNDKLLAGENAVENASPVKINVAPQMNERFPERRLGRADRRVRVSNNDTIIPSAIPHAATGHFRSVISSRVGQPGQNTHTIPAVNIAATSAVGEKRVRVEG